MGNAANAASAAKQVAKMALTQRKNVFLASKLLSLSVISEARINTVRNLLLGDFCMALTNSGIRIGEVIPLYSKTGGKNGYHSAVPSVANVAAISNVAVQVFQQMHHRIFRQTTTAFGTRYFQILPSTHLLTRLMGKTVRSQNGNLEIGMDDLRIFKSLCMEPERFQVATKMFAQRGKNKVAQESAAC